MKQQIDALPATVATKKQLSQQMTELEQQIDTLPAKIVLKDKLALEIDLLTLEKDRLNTQHAIYGTLIQALGGAFFVITAYFTYRNVRAAEEKQVTERFSKAVEQIGNEQIQVRVGGIYSLERIAKDSPKDHWTIMEVLTSFVQEKSQKRHIPNTKITLDIQSALIVIGRRDFSKDPEYGSFDLSNTNLQEANLSRANLSGANLSNVNLQKANLGEANLSGANLSRANLSETELLKAKLEHAHLISANLSESNLAQASLRKASLLNTDLHEAILTHADFSMSLNLTPEQVKSAQGWEQATYDEDFRKKLGLLPKFVGENRETE